MGRPVQYKFVSNNSVIASTEVNGTAPSPFQLTNPFPVGDMIYQSLDLRLSGTLDLDTGGGTVVTDGGLQFIRQLWLSTPQHAMIIEGLDGILLHDIGTVKKRGPLIHTDVSSSAQGGPSWEYFLHLPFKDEEAYNFADQGLDVLRSGNPFLQLNLGVFGDFISGGNSGDGVDVYNMETTLRLDPGPVNIATDAPTQFMPYKGVLKFPVSSTVLQQQIFLAFGDRIIKKLFITQRNSSSLARLANTVVGANDTDRLSLKINSNFPWVDRLEWLALQDMNACDYRLSSMPTGMAVIDFSQFVAGQNDKQVAHGQAGYKLSNALSVLSKNQGTLELDIDVTSVSNGQLWIGYDAVKVLPAGARRPAPPPQGAPSNVTASTGGGQ